MKQVRTKKEEQELRKNILRAEGKAGLKAFYAQQRAGGMPPAKQVHGNRTKDVARGSSRKPKHKGRIFD